MSGSGETAAGRLFKTHAQPMPDPTPQPANPRRKRPLILALAIIVALATLVVAPPLINANRLAHRIATSMSQSLGRPVHLDSVSLHLLPTPGFTMQNFVVSEDPAFGYEPVIRANRVEASVRVASLWRRQVEFSSVRFVVDENGSAPSMNLVRRADGRWNLESILLHAAQNETAPTAQSKAGPAPRFPYIEATGARINIKMGDEKEPFALTETDFALWLPSPRQWRVRLEGKPTRTDTSVFDTGLLHVEATLDRASRLADVPLDLTAEWKRAPLGQASILLTGADMGWRGDIDVTATAHGTLANAAVTTTLKLNKVRRSEFIPDHPIALQVECTGHLALTAAIVSEPACTLPTGDPDASPMPRSVLAATADSLNLTTLHAVNPHLGMTQVPETWLLAWARLFSPRIPPHDDWTGTLSGSITNTPAFAESLPSGLRPATPAAIPVWSGTFQTDARKPDPAATTSARAGVIAATPPSLTLTLTADGLSLAPFNLAAPGQPTLTLSGNFTAAESRLQFNGTSTAAELHALQTALPPLTDGIAEALLPAQPQPEQQSADPSPIRLDLTCTRTWNAPQTCTPTHATELSSLHPKHRNR